MVGLLLAKARFDPPYDFRNGTRQSFAVNLTRQK